MDPLSALGLAGNIVQFIDFGCKLFSEARLQLEILEELESMVTKHRAEDWFFHHDSLPTDTHQATGLDTSARVILAHFHYSCKGHIPFQPGFDWDYPQVQRLTRLRDEQIAFLKRCCAGVRAKAALFDDIRHGDRRFEKYYYTSQLFDPDWKPRDH